MGPWAGIFMLSYKLCYKLDYGHPIGICYPIDATLMLSHKFNIQV